MIVHVISYNFFHKTNCNPISFSTSTNTVFQNTNSWNNVCIRHSRFGLVLINSFGFRVMTFLFLTFHIIVILLMVKFTSC